MKVTVRNEGGGQKPTVFHDPKDRRRPFIWFGDDVPEWVRDGDAVEIEKTGLRRPQWRIVEPAKF